MNILVATDGQLDPASTATMVARLAGSDDTVTVLTVIDHPREALRGFAVNSDEDLDKILRNAVATLGVGAGQVVASRLEQHARTEKGAAQPLDVYFGETADRLQRDMLATLAEHGIEASSRWSPTENKTARTILNAAERLNAGILIIGSHGQGRFEGFLGSTTTKLVRLSQIPVVLVK